MSGSMVRKYDKGFFAPGGLFETLADERPNSLLPRWTYDRGNTDPTKKVLTREEVNELIGNSSTRPLAPESRLSELTQAANLDSESIKKSERIYNMSVNDITKKTANAYVGIINDLTTINIRKPSTVIDIFTKDDRLIYIGISMIIYAIFLMLIRLADFK